MTEGVEQVHGSSGGGPFGRGRIMEDLEEVITPAKICVTLLLRNYILFVKNPDEDPDESTLFVNSGGGGGGDLENRTLNARQRKNFCLLAIKLIQGVDRPLADLVKVVLGGSTATAAAEHGGGGGGAVTQSLFKAWKRDMLTVVDSEGVGGLMDLSFSLEKMVSVEVQVPLLHRSSVVGLFLRRMVLCFERLNFSDVANLHGNFKRYYAMGSPALHRHLEPAVSSAPGGGNGGCDLDMSSFSAEVANINSKLMTPEESDAATETGNLLDFTIGKVSRKQAELYIANQVELLQKAQVHAHPPEKMAMVVAKILEHNPDLSEAHFLSYLNCMRVNDYTGAMESINKCFVSGGKRGGRMAGSNGNNPANDPANGQDGLTPPPGSAEDLNKGFRYAALNTAAMHARFNHKQEALSALQEAIMMAQEANDHVCLQHALSWLYRLQPSSERTMTLMERCVAKSNEFNMSYLTSLGIQALSQYAALTAGQGGGPSKVVEILSRSEVLNCQHSITELVTLSYAQKSSLWTLYGKTEMSCVVSQLLLNLNTADRTRDGIFVTAEATAISLSNLARHLHDNGHEKACDKVLALARKLFPNETSVCGEVWNWTQHQVEFQRCLFRTDWKEADDVIVSLMSVTDDKLKLDPLFMKYQLHLARGGDRGLAADLHAQLMLHWKEMTPSNQVRLLLLQTELACLTETYPTAIPNLLQAKEICDRYKLDYLSANVHVHLAHLQLQMGMAEKALELLRKYLPTIFAHGGIYESCRAKVLLAKCLVAAAPRNPSDSKQLDKRSEVHQAIAKLKEAAEGFSVMKAHLRHKEALYLMARLYQFLDLIEERNQVAAEFKKVDEQHATHGTSFLATVL